MLEIPLYKKSTAYFGLGLILIFCVSSCTTLGSKTEHWTADGKLNLVFAENVEKVEEAPQDSLTKVFHRVPILMKPLKGVDAPWVFVYRVDIGDGPWYLAKGPLTATIPQSEDLKLNFSYILENYNDKLKVTYEDLKLGKAFATRYFFPVGKGSSVDQLYVVGFYSEEPIDCIWYRRFDRIASTVRIVSDSPESG